MATKSKVKSKNGKRQSPKKASKRAPTKTKAAPRKKASIRDKIRNVGLDGRKFSKIKQEYHDLDYIDQLSPEEKNWMSRFMEEYLGARVKHSGKKVHKDLRTKAGRKRLYDANNARNRDMYSLARATGLLNDADPGEAIEAIQFEHYNAHQIEDKLIDQIDESRIESTTDTPDKNPTESE